MTGSTILLTVGVISNLGTLLYRWFEAVVRPWMIGEGRGGVEPTLASRVSRGICTKLIRNFWVIQLWGCRQNRWPRPCFKPRGPKSRSDVRQFPGWWGHEPPILCRRCIPVGKCYICSFIGDMLHSGCSVVSGVVTALRSEPVNVHVQFLVW